MIETSQLQTLVAVTHAKSFSKAAENIGVTQSAISQSIKNLESKLEIKIFKRSGKNVVLTPEGERLYQFGARFIAEMKDTLDDLQSDKNTMRGKVRIAFGAAMKLEGGDYAKLAKGVETAVRGL